MINLNYDQIISRIMKEADISQEELEKKIHDKMESLSGLVSKEGAAHIIANELGVKLFEAPGKLQIQDIIAGMKNVEVVGRVVQIYEIREFQKEDRSGKVANFILGDPTGVVRVVLWNSQADKLLSLQEKMPVKIKDAYAKENNGRIELHLNDRSELILNPEEEVPEEIKEFRREFKRKIISELQENDQGVEILGTIVQVFEPRYWVVNEEGRKVKEGEIPVGYSYVTNFQIDDGTDTIRVVCFKDQTQQLFSKTDQEMNSYRENHEKLSELRNNMIGAQVKVQGRVVKNEMFDRKELIANNVDTKPDPSEELTMMKSQTVVEHEEESVE